MAEEKERTKKVMPVRIGRRPRGNRKEGKIGERKEEIARGEERGRQGKSGRGATGMGSGGSEGQEGKGEMRN